MAREVKNTGSHQRRGGKTPPAPRVQKDMMPGLAEEEAGEPALNHEQARIKKWLRQLRFKKAVFGGVDEADVWKKLGELNSLYEAALSAERARYDALMQEYVQAEAVRMAKRMLERAAPDRSTAKAGDGADG